MENSEENLSENQDRQEGKNETIGELAHRHLKDESHTTTDEELKNAQLEVDKGSEVDPDLEKMYEVDNTTVLPELPAEKSSDTDTTKKDDKDPPHHLPNPYDVLG